MSDNQPKVEEQLESNLEEVFEFVALPVWELTDSELGEFARLYSEGVGENHPEGDRDEDTLAQNRIMQFVLVNEFNLRRLHTIFCDLINRNHNTLLAELFSYELVEEGIHVNNDVLIMTRFRGGNAINQATVAGLRASLEVIQNERRSSGADVYFTVKRPKPTDEEAYD